MNEPEHVWACDRCGHLRKMHVDGRGECLVFDCECHKHTEYDYSDDAPSEGRSLAEEMEWADRIQRTLK